MNVNTLPNISSIDSPEWVHVHLHLPESYSQTDLTESDRNIPTYSDFNRGCNRKLNMSHFRQLSM